MINKKLLSFDPAAMRYVWRCVLCQWLSLLCNVAFVWALNLQFPVWPSFIVG